MKTTVSPAGPGPRVLLRLALFGLAIIAPWRPATLYAAREQSALNGEKQSYALSWEQEVKEGAEADKEITQQMGLYDNPQVQAYVQSVGQRVLQTSTFADPNTPEMYRNTKFTFRVLDSPVVNAFALPGGYVYVTRGLLAHVDNEAQLAVVLGHEIGHVAARHASQQARRSQWSQLGVIAGAILGQAVLGDRMPNLAENVLNTGGQAMQVFMLRYSREAENEADTLGMQYALKSGYAAEDSARFFDALRRLSQTEGKGIPTWMSSHPDPGNRADHVVQLARANRTGPAERRLGTDEFLRAVDGIVLGEDPRQGFEQNGVFYHPTLRFQMPVAAGWKLDNQPGAVVFAEPNGRALMGLRMAAANRTRDAASQFVSQNKIQVTGSGDTTINGLPATVVMGRAASEKGQLGVWNAFIEYNGKIFSLLGYAPEQAFEQVRPTFESVAAGFGPLRDSRMANVQPVHLRVVRADRSAPFATFVPTSLPPDFSAEKVAIMNQVALNGNVPAGAPIKLPDAANAGIGQPAVLGSVDNPTGTTPAPYPGSATGYPAPGYPPQQPSTPYPDSSYPGQASGYPPQGSQYPNPYPPTQSPNQYPAYPGSAPSSTYPAPGYPGQTQTPQSYPAANPYPPGNAYPPSGSAPSSYPGPGGYPSTNYPPAGGQQAPYGTPPGGATGYPQFPQPGQNASGPQGNQPPPNWPR